MMQPTPLQRRGLNLPLPILKPFDGAFMKSKAIKIWSF